MDGIIGTVPNMVHDLCHLISGTMATNLDIQGYTFAEQKDMKLCGVYTLRTALYITQQSSVQFTSMFYKIQLLQRVIMYVEEKLIRNVIKNELYKHNEPEKYQEKLVKCFIIYGLLKYQKHFLDHTIVDMNKISNILSDKHIHYNFKCMSEKYNLGKYSGVIEDMIYHLQNHNFKRNMCRQILTESYCQWLNKFPTGSVTHSDFIKGDNIEQVLHRKHVRLNELILGHVIACPWFD
jgi:hypothetical protein